MRVRLTNTPPSLRYWTNRLSILESRVIAAFTIARITTEKACPIAENTIFGFLPKLDAEVATTLNVEELRACVHHCNKSFQIAHDLSPFGLMAPGQVMKRTLDRQLRHPVRPDEVQ